ncbi:hypothetical protein T08_11445 [Trichinella sp. T8]|nr:hypothetical protein T08_11445 [Trichinella sp. T8]
MPCIISKDSKTIGVLDIGGIRLRHQLSFYGVPFALRYVISHQISLSQSSSVRSNPDNVLVRLLLSVRFQCDMTKISGCGVRHPMKLVPFATRVRMDVKAFPSRSNVPLLITNAIFLSLWTPCLVMFTSVCSKCGITNIGNFGYVKCAHFIHDSITLTSSEFDVSSDGPLS